MDKFDGTLNKTVSPSNQNMSRDTTVTDITSSELSPKG